MALRAGYYGIKRAFRDKLEQIIPSEASNVNPLVLKAEVESLWYNNGFTGVHNFNTSNYEVSGNAHGITWTIDSDGVIDADGTTDENSTSSFVNDFTAPITAQMIASGLNSSDQHVQMFPYDLTDSARPYKDSTKTARLGNNDNVWNGNELSFYMEKGHRYAMYCRILKYTPTPTTITVDHQKFYPLIRLADDTSKVFTPYAKTNQQLTASAADQKTAINAIITAATEATDFAAFKAAMEAITPVTRTLSMAAAPEEITEEPVEEPVTKKRTTKKSTKTEEV